MELHIFYYIEVMRQFKCKTEKLLTSEASWWATQAFIMSRETVGGHPLNNRLLPSLKPSGLKLSMFTSYEGIHFKLLECM